MKFKKLDDELIARTKHGVIRLSVKEPCELLDAPWLKENYIHDVWGVYNVKEAMWEAQELYLNYKERLKG